MTQKNLIHTQSFELAVLERGNKDSNKLAVLIPGRLDTKDYANFVSHAEFLADRGFFAVAFDPPGVWESGGEITTYTTTHYLKAIDELITYFGNKPTVLLGHSRGGTAAILASENPTVKSIALIMANYGMPSAPSEEGKRQGFQVSYRDLPPGTSKTGEQKKFALPISYWEDASHYNPMEILKKCRKPKLLVCGTKDEFISPDEVRRVFELIPQPKMFQEIDCEHDYRYHPDATEKVNKILESFLESEVFKGDR